MIVDHDSPGVVAGAWEAATALAGAVADGAALPSIASPVLLAPAEVLHASIGAHAWRYQALDVTFGHRRVIALGGPFAFGLTAVASAVANRRTRLAAERQAAPQWRFLGHLPVLATSERLFVLHEGAWASVWYGAIRQLRPALAEHRIELVFEDDPPYALQGPWVPYLAVALTTLLAEDPRSETVARSLLPA